MKYVTIVLVGAALALFSGCGGSQNTIKSVQVSPQQAQGVAGPNATVGFTANGTFQNNQSRLLTSEDGLTWSSSNTTVATINASTGEATCQAVGTVTITAAVPSDLTFQLGGHTASSTVNGTATLQCVPEV